MDTNQKLQMLSKKSNKPEKIRNDKFDNSKGVHRVKGGDPGLRSSYVP